MESKPLANEDHSHARVRKRTRIACDKCSSFRVRCDGQLPCRRCQEYGHSCQYARDIKKRGRKPASRRFTYINDLDVQTPLSNRSPDSIRQDGPSPSPNLASPDVQNFQFGPSSYLNDQSLETGSNGFTPEPHSDVPTSRTIHRRSPSLGKNAREKELENGLRRPASLRDPSRSSFPATLPSPGPVPPRKTNQSIRRISQLIDPPQESAVLPTSNAEIFREQQGHYQRDSRVELFAGGGYGHQRCRYRCLEPVLPLLDGIIEPEVACDLLEFYFAQPDSSLFRTASPYVLTHVLRKQSLLHPTRPRKTSSALLVTMLWVCVQTADMPTLLLPGSRGNVSEELRKLAMSLVHERDRDHWYRASGGRLIQEERYCANLRDRSVETFQTEDQPPYHSIDDVLTLILLTIVISGGDFKTDSSVWWSKAVRLAQSMGLNLQDEKCNDTNSACMKILCECRTQQSAAQTSESIEDQEERRRVFWLLFSLDRHLALSFNGNLYLTDDECRVYSPLPDDVWENLDVIPVEQFQHRMYGPPTLVTGTGFFEYFLPLMAILGDVIQIHHRRGHPRLGALDDQDAVNMIENQLANLAQSIIDLSKYHHLERLDTTIPASHASSVVLTPSTTYSEDPMNHIPSSSPTALVPIQTSNSVSNSKAAHQRRKSRLAQAQLVTSYSTFILHVLHVLLHGKWDAVSMLSSSTDPTISDWITSPSFVHCASHAIHASDAVSKILLCDPELTFMPYLFGIYLLHGSFILLLFADRMPQVGGPNESVERACETIIRAHEVCVVTLSTEFQKRFRKVLRSTLYSVREGNVNGNGNGLNEPGPGEETTGRLGSGSMGINGASGLRSGERNVEEGKARRRVLSLYRWTSGSRGLAL